MTSSDSSHSVIPLARGLSRKKLRSTPMRVTLIGSGYVGLVTGACLAKLGHEVICADIDQEKVGTLKRGVPPIYERGLAELMAANTARLHFTADVAEAVRRADIVMIAVGTPPGEAGMPDLSHVETAARNMGPLLAPGAVVVLKSTVPVGTARAIRRRLAESCPHDDFSVASNPEFLREGSAIEDFLHPDRIVAGIADERADAALRRLYRPLTLAGAPLLATSCEDAEMIKYAANAFLAMKITFINEVADLCEQFGGNVDDVARGIGLDQRIGTAFLNAGPGFGGSCFPKDTRALAAVARHHSTSLRLVETVIALNERRQEQLVERVVEAFGSDLRGATVAQLGLAFKQNTDDVRESPGLVILRKLQAQGARLQVHDPSAMANGRRIAEAVAWCDDPYDACNGANIVVIATDWDIFRKLDLRRLRSAMKGDLVVDFRNLFVPEQIAGTGIRYVSIGRPPVDGLELAGLHAVDDLSTAGIRRPALGEASALSLK